MTDLLSQMLIYFDRPAEWAPGRRWTGDDAAITARVGSLIRTVAKVDGEAVSVGGDYIVTAVDIIEDGARLRVVAER